MPNPNVPPIPGMINAAEQAKIRAWLTAHGHDTARVAKAKMGTHNEMRQAICELHGVSAQEYEAARR